MGEKDPNFTFPFLPLARLMHSPDHPSSGMATPPLQTLASVPFKWEEQPGKPRPCTDIMVIPDPAKRLELELPPCRMEKITRMPSPIAVLDGPYNVGRPKFYSFRLFDTSHEEAEGSDVNYVLLGNTNKRKWFFKLKSGGRKEGGGGGSFGFSHSYSGSDERWKMRRSGSFSGHRSTHLSWAAVYQSLKQVIIPWKSIGKSKKDGSVGRT